ncbi:MAG: hypothetical protein ACFHU9_06115 [Fluviicola sp.]
MKTTEKHIISRLNTVKKPIITAFMLVLGFSGLAQVPAPKTSEVLYEDDMRPSLEVTVVPEPKEVKRAWHDFVKDNYDVDLDGIGLFSNKDILSAEEVKIEKLSSQHIDFMTKITATEGGTKMEVFAAKGYDIYIDPVENPEEFGRMDLMVRDFLADYIPAYYSEQIEDQSEEVEDLAKKRNKQKKEIDENEEEIAQLKEEIASLQDAIEQSEADLEETEKMLDSERQKLEELRAQLAQLEM